jgi:ArsR family transcriptional regulator
MKLSIITKINHACSHEKRLEVLRFLRNKKFANVTTIAKSIGMPVKSTSKHLLILHQAHVVKREREGIEIYYSLNRPLNEIMKTIINLL